MDVAQYDWSLKNGLDHEQHKRNITRFVCSFFGSPKFLEHGKKLACFFLFPPTLAAKLPVVGACSLQVSKWFCRELQSTFIPENSSYWQPKLGRVFTNLKILGRFTIFFHFILVMDGTILAEFVLRLWKGIECNGSEDRYDAVIDAFFSEPNRQRTDECKFLQFLSFPHILSCFCVGLRLSLVSTWGILSRNTTSTTIKVLQPFGLRSVDPPFAEKAGRKWPRAVGVKGFIQVIIFW